MKVKLYTTLGCHLCEQAHDLLVALQAERTLTIVPVEIADDDSLVEQYGIRIPVVVTGNSGQELGWPFNLDQLRAYLDTNHA